MNYLGRRLLKAKLKGWSVVRGNDCTVIRPPNRSLGKIKVKNSFRDESLIYVSVFVQKSRIWMFYTTFKEDNDIEVQIMLWAERIFRELENGENQNRPGSDHLAS